MGQDGIASAQNLAKDHFLLETRLAGSAVFSQGLSVLFIFVGKVDHGQD